MKKIYNYILKFKFYFSHEMDFDIKNNKNIIFTFIVACQEVSRVGIRQYFST